MTTSTGEARGPDGAAQDRLAIPVDSFAARVMLARAHVGLNIEDAAQKCGLNRQSWSNWERGMKPRDMVEVVEAISDGLGIDRDWLLFGGPLAKPEKRHRDVRRGNRLSYPRAAGEAICPIIRGNRPVVRARPWTFGRRPDTRDVSRRPPVHPTDSLRRAA
jgi:transcriptional regulator with XRE-family HTH domain